MSAQLTDLQARITKLEAQLDGVIPVVKGFQASNAALQAQIAAGPDVAAGLQAILDEMDAHSAAFDTALQGIINPAPATPAPVAAPATPPAGQ